MKHILLSLCILIFMNNCTLLNNLIGNEDIKFLKERFNQGKILSLDHESTGKLLDIRDFSTTGSYYYVVEGANKRRINIYDGLGNFLAEISSYTVDRKEFKFKFPSSVFYNKVQNNFYVLDSLDKKIILFSRDGRYLSEFSHFSYDVDDGNFFPALIRKSGINENILIVDTYNNRVIEINSRGNVISTIPNLKEGAETLELPQSVAQDSAGNYYVASDKHIKVFSLKGEFQFSFTKRGAISKISDVVIWRSKYIVACDPINGKVFFFTRSGRFITEWSNMAPGKKFQSPFRLFVDDTERLYIVDNSMGEIVYY